MSDAGLKITKMPFEKHSYILTGNTDRNYIPRRNNYINEDWISMVKWLNDNEVRYHINGNILTFLNEQDETLFILRFFNG
jgi:cupin superfamily acireductone dioxygenase involved in methionine salvage